MNRLAIAGALPFLMAAAPAMDAETRKDVRCFAALAALAADGESENAMKVAVVTQYYLGRIDARMPGLDLENAIAAEAEAIAPAEVQGLVQTCAKTVEDRGRDLMKIGRNLQNRAKPPSTS